MNSNVTAATGGTGKTQPKQPPPESKAKATMAGGDFQTFLKMLTAQIKNQDPLNPMEGSDFAVQLATFSGVEQQVQTNALLKQLAGSIGGESLTAYSDWIGKQVRTKGQVYFGNDPLTIELSRKPDADRSVLIVADAFGRNVSAETLDKQNGLVNWSGVDPNGARLPPGLYSFTLENYRGDKLISRDKVAAYSNVVEIRQQSGKIVFKLDGGATAGPADIDAIAAGKG